MDTNKKEDLERDPSRCLRYSEDPDVSRNRSGSSEYLRHRLARISSSFVPIRVPSWAILFLLLTLCGAMPTTSNLLYADDFKTDLDQWKNELENGGSVSSDRGYLDINVPAGATVWFQPMLTGPVMIEYKATAISAGGANDRVSDLNCFWMARDSRNRDDLFAVHRSGKFADYNQLLTYYVGLGGNSNTTTRFRRYIGAATTRPLRPQDDLRDKADLLMPNVEQTIRLIAADHTIEFYRDGKRLFQMEDEHPYTSGWFAFRTTASHLRIRDFRVYAVKK